MTTSCSCIHWKICNRLSQSQRYWNTIEHSVQADKNKHCQWQQCSISTSEYCAYPNSVNPLVIDIFTQFATHTHYTQMTVVYHHKKCVLVMALYALVHGKEHFLIGNISCSYVTCWLCLTMQQVLSHLLLSWDASFMRVICKISIQICTILKKGLRSMNGISILHCGMNLDQVDVQFLQKIKCLLECVYFL